jgi:type IV pilus assembly protein PilP
MNLKQRFVSSNMPFLNKRIRSNNFRIAFGVVISGFVLTGCSSQVDVVALEMKKIHEQPALAIEPAPVFLPVPTFTYAAQGLRSPFLPLSLAQELKIMAGKRVMPDLTRPPQFLEQFALETIRMRGTLRNLKGPLFGLIEDPDGGVTRVKVGNYVGKNYGRIVGITPSQINIVEVVPDGKDGFIERPRSLIMVDTGI